jgi:tRNA 2-thiouridine synthesizing protein A
MDARKTLDVRGLKCPMPIIRAKKELEATPAGDVLKVVATDPGSVLDFQGWIKAGASCELLGQEEDIDEQGRKTFVHYLRRRP